MEIALQLQSTCSVYKMGDSIKQIGYLTGICSYQCLKLSFKHDQHLC